MIKCSISYLLSEIYEYLVIKIQNSAFVLFSPILYNLHNIFSVDTWIVLWPMYIGRLTTERRSQVLVKCRWCIGRFSSRDVCFSTPAVDSRLTVDQHVGRVSVECRSSNDFYIDRCIGRYIRVVGNRWESVNGSVWLRDVLRPLSMASLTWCHQGFESNMSALEFTWLGFQSCEHKHISISQENFLN